MFLAHTTMHFTFFGNESNVEFQTDSHEQSLRLVSEMNNWHRIMCEENGELLSIPDIHKKVWDAVKNML